MAQSGRFQGGTWANIQYCFIINSNNTFTEQHPALTQHCGAAGLTGTWSSQSTHSDRQGPWRWTLKKADFNSVQDRTQRSSEFPATGSNPGIQWKRFLLQVAGVNEKTTKMPSNLRLGLFIRVWITQCLLLLRTHFPISLLQIPWRSLPSVKRES